MMTVREDGRIDATITEICLHLVSVLVLIESLNLIMLKLILLM